MSASAPEAPPLSVTTSGCFMRLFFWMAACIMRAIWSDAPPAPAATTISTGLVGSQAAVAAVLNAARLAANRAAFLISPPDLVLCGAARRGTGAGREIFHRRLHAFLLSRHAGERKAHLDRKS